MNLLCPTCGNPINLKIRYDQREGFCPLCKRDFKILRQKKKSKTFITLTESED